MSESRVLNLLVVDADAEMREACKHVAGRCGGFAVRTVGEANALRDTIRAADVHLILMDLRLPDGGLELLREVREARPDCVVIIASAVHSLQFAVEAMRYGAYDFLSKPMHYEELRLCLERAADKWKRSFESRKIRDQLTIEHGFMDMVGKTSVMERLFSLIQRATPGSAPVLVTGEAGTGKEMAARGLHKASSRKDHPFVLVDCRTPLRSLEALLREAGEGTLFLDEIGELPLEIQGQLVRAIHTRELKPTMRKTVPVQCRIVASTVRDLDALSASGQFRRDLYFALNTVKIHVPALRDRRDDIPLLANHFFERAKQTRSIVMSLPEDLVRRMMKYEWRNNVRELETCIERACSSAVGAVISQRDLMTRIASQLEPEESERPEGDSLGIVPLAVLERNAILAALEKVGGDRLEAANRLGIGKTTLYRKIKEYELEGARVI